MRAGDLTVRIHEDSGGIPGALVANGVSNAVPTSALNAKTQQGAGPVLFEFARPRPALASGASYFVVLETNAPYGDNHGVTQWLVDTDGAGLYGEAGAVWQNHSDLGWHQQATYAYAMHVQSAPTTEVCADTGGGVLVGTAQASAEVPLWATLTANTTGSATWDLTRDDGVTWVPANLDEGTWLGDSPVGTTLRYRATIASETCVDSVGMAWR